MTEEAPSPVDFKPTRSNLVEEIKGQLMNLNDAVSKARAAQRFQHTKKPSSEQVYASAYENFDRLFGLTRELLSKELIKNAEAWLDHPTPISNGTTPFLEDLTTYKRLIDRELFNLGIKDTNLRKPVVFPMQFHDEEYARLDTNEPEVDPPIGNFSVRGTEVMME